jgi:hypothetical protein
MPIPDTWHVHGSVFGQNGPASSLEGNIYLYGWRNGAEYWLANANFNAGNFTLTFARDQFQFGNAEIAAPDVIFRIYDYQGNLIWQYGPVALSGSDSSLNPLLGGGIAAPEAPDTPSGSGGWEVSGFVRDSQGYLVTLGKVHAYDISGDARTELGSVSLGSSGQYRISFASSSAPSLKVCLYYPAGVLLSESEIVNNSSPSQTIDLLVQSVSSSETESEYCVFGHVTNNAGLPVAHHVVKAYVLRMATETSGFEELELGFVPTDINGYYEISYDHIKLEFPISEEPPSHGAGTASLFIKLPKAQGYDTSPIVCHSAKRQQIDIQVDRPSGSDSSEYDLVRFALSGYISAMEHRLGEYEPDFSNRMQYISCKTGVEESKVVCFYYSMHFAKRVEDALKANDSNAVFNAPLDFEKFMYAAFRAGYLGSDVLALCAAEPEKHYRVLADAIRNRVVSESAAANLESFWAQWLETARILAASVGTANAESASISVFARTILEAGRNSPLAPEDILQIQKATEVYQDVRGDMPSFWNEMRAKANLGEFTELFVAQLIFIDDLYSISSGFVPFAQGAYYYFAKNKASSYSSEMEAYNIGNLASLYDGEWLGMAYSFLNYTKGNYPPCLVGGTDEEKTNILAMTAKKLYEDKFPLENVASYYATKIESNEALSEDLREALQNVGEFLASPEADGLDLDSTNIDGCGLSGKDKDTLKTLQRINRLTEDPPAQVYLISEGYDSAYKIAIEDEEKFVADHAEKLGGIDEARQVHRLAAMYATETLAILSKFHNSLNFSGDKSLSAVNRGVSQIQPPGSDPVPTYETLFGTLSEARFANSQSVFGASAYFVDLLGFIDGVSRKSIFSRRPELKEIELTDGNAETILPYIDIAIEILENTISPRVFFFRTSVEFFNEDRTEIPTDLMEIFKKRAIDIPGTSKIKKSLTKSGDYYLSTGSWRIHFSRKSISNPPAKGYLVTAYPQTSKASSDLSVMPEHRNPLAYEALSSLCFPLQLPLNPAADEVQETLRLLGTSKHDSIIAFRRDIGKRYEDSNKSLVCASLGISDKIRMLLESPPESNAWELWGLQETNNGNAYWVDVMSYVPDFMQRTGLGVEGMLDIFALKALNETGRENIIRIAGDDKGQQTGAPGYFEIKNLNADDLTDIHRLLRLRGILKCGWRELDCFLRSAHGGTLPDDLRKISVARLFMARYPSISFADVGCFWGPLAMSVDKRFGKSPFEERFLAKRLTDETVAVFKELKEKKSIDFSSSIKALRQALQLSAEDLDCIIGNEIASGKNKIGINSISKILRVVLLSNALKLGIDDFYALRKLTEINPFEAATPENILYFADESSRLSKHGIKAGAVKKFLEEESPACQGNAEWVQSAIRSLREITAVTEEFLASSAVPNFGEEEGTWDEFKENYRKEHTRSQVEILLTELFSGFTGGDSELADSLLEQKRSLWSGLANVGWSRSLDGGEVCITEDFSLPEYFLENGGTATWSAVLIAPGVSEISFKLNSGGCAATLTVEEQLIKITANNFSMEAEYYIDLLLAYNDVDFSGGTSASYAKIPLSMFIPATSRVVFEELESTLPAFCKMAECFELTKMNPGFFRAVMEKGKTNSEWEISLHDWKKFKRLLDIQTLYAKFPTGESSFWEMVDAVETAEKNEGSKSALSLLAEMQNKWDKVNLIGMVENSVGENLSSASGIASPAMLTYILENMPVIEKIGVPVEILVNVQKASPDEGDVASFRGALQQHLGMVSWNKMVEDMMNAMRIRQRDAMTAFLTFAGPSITVNANSNAQDGLYLSYLCKALANAGVLDSENSDIRTALGLYSQLVSPLAIPSNWQIGPAQWAVLDGRKGYRDSNEIYANFLIDTEMNTEMITSRIVQASAAIQLFVQRVLLGLEPASHLDERDIAQWAWVKNYRVWEANRKVFLYPENWIEPELRDDKTPFFKEFEAEFENGEITSQIAENALGNFLSKIREVSVLDIIGVCGGESNNPRGKDTLHIIGKTKSLPHKYYYRRCCRKNNLPGVWEPWEAIGIDIQGNSVLPVMFNGHLYVFWAQFKPADNPGEPETITYEDDSKETHKLPMPMNTAVVDLSLSWAALADGKWTEKKQTPSFIDTENAFYTNQKPGDNVADSYHFSVKDSSDEFVQIEVRKTFYEDATAGAGKILKIQVAGVYTVWHDGNVGFAKAVGGSKSEFCCDPRDTLFIENYAASFESRAFARLSGTKLLGRTNGGYKYLSANSGLLTGSSDEPGFLMEDSRTYFIERSDNGKTAASYKMETVSHPIAREFQRRFENGGLASLMRRETQALAMATGRYYGYSYYSYNYYFNVLLGYYAAGDWQAWDAGQNAFELRYLPNERVVSRPFPMEVVDFNYGTPCGIYNWELFFHAPFLVARQLAANQRYDEALDWYHLIFDPRSNKLSGYEKTKRWALKLPAGARFWNFLPFFANADANKTIMELMGLPDSRGRMPDSQALRSLVDDWKNDPFNPHLIARSRIVAYQKAVVMHYLDAMLAWADQKFRIDTLESINEAIQLYILAAEILGARPQSVPVNFEVEPLSYTQMQAMNMDSFSNVVAQLENSLVKPVDDAKGTGQGPIADSASQVLNLGPKMYYFVVPRNEKLMGYWDLLDDRLFKIRNGMNIEGVKRQLSLFAPPIDPGMLVKAAAAGIDIGAALGDMFTPVPKYRFTFMVQKAIELCNVVQSMGGAVLSALEKKDAEEIARLRAEHEGVLLKLSKEMKKMQIDEAGIAIEGLEKTKENMEVRREYYEKLISGGISNLEQKQLDKMSEAANYSEAASLIRLAASFFAPLPNTIFGASGFGGSPHVTMEVSPASIGVALASITASGLDFLASNSQNSASQAGINAGYERRKQEWEFQMSIAEKEIEGMERQILGAQIRKQVAEKELSNLEKQIEQSEEVYAFLKDKYTNKELYQWMIKELSSLYNKIYQLAYDTAKRAEKSYGFELGVSDSSFIQFGYWDGLRKGLLAGERLMLDLRRMEMSYIEKNSRELEITKPVSIAQLNPYAILELQETGSCSFSLPEALFDLDFPGHYFRRIRSVRLTIPCVAGPYTSVSATLTLLRNSMRKNPTGSSYTHEEEGDDPRFVDQRVGIQGIATSQPSEATGMFDFSFRDERYLPFEGAGAISEWRLELPANLRQFDYRTISDIVLHISYTAREDGRLKKTVNDWIGTSVANMIKALSESGETLNRAFSIKREFTDAWNSLLKNGEAKIKTAPEHFPYFLKGKELIVGNLEIFVLGKEPNELKNSIAIDNLEGESAFFEYTISSSEIEVNEELDDIILNLNYSVN